MPQAPGKTLRETLDGLNKSLKSRRQSWEPIWKDITQQLIPYRMLDVKADRGRGDRKDGKIINNTPIEAMRVLSAGMMAGITSPARKWWTLSPSDPEQEKNKDIRLWLDEVQTIINFRLQRSNFYKTLADAIYPDLGAVGQSCMFAEEDTESPGSLHFRDLLLKTYVLNKNEKGEVDTMIREFQLEVRQMDSKFGIDNCSQDTRAAFHRGEMNRMIDVVHAVLPNADYQAGAVGSRGKRFGSYWWESKEPRKGHFLRQGGYEEFPIIAPGWSSRHSDPYSRGPGWDVRGDCRALQHAEKTMLAVWDKLVNPPMTARGAIDRPSLLPGDVTVTPRGAEHSFEPAIQTSPLATAMQHAMPHIHRHEERIRRGLYNHLWQMLINDDRSQRATATEIEAQRQEVMLMLGPLLESLNSTLLEPVIRRSFNVLMRNNQLPLPPDELQGQSLKIDFISVLHQVQQATGLGPMRTLVAEVMNLSQVRPEAIDKLNPDAIVDEYHKITGVRPDAILSDEEVTQVRQQRAQEQQQQQAMEQAMAGAETAQKLSQVDAGNLSEVANTLSPAAAAQGGVLGPA